MNGAKRNEFRTNPRAMSLLESKLVFFYPVILVTFVSKSNKVIHHTGGNNMIGVSEMEGLKSSTRKVLYTFGSLRKRTVELIDKI